MGTQEAIATQEVEFLSEKNNDEPKIYYGIFTVTQLSIRGWNFRQGRAGKERSQGEISRHGKSTQKNAH